MDRFYFAAESLLAGSSPQESANNNGVILSNNLRILAAALPRCKAGDDQIRAEKICRTSYTLGNLV